MGVVFLAHQIDLDREVAIKCVRTDTFSGEDGLKRFMREAKVLASLEHQGIVRIFDVDKLDEVLFIVSEFIDGCTLKHRIRQTQFRLRPAVRLIRDIASTIDFVHRKNIIHRDIKSENILLPKEGGIKVIDFGLARDYGDGASQSITKTGEFLGTAEYMAPEIILAQQVTALCDVYALGCLFYEVLSGHYPFSGSPMEILNQHMKIPFPKVSTSRCDCPSSIDEIIQRATMKDPALRTESAAVLVSELTAFLDSPDSLSTVGSLLPGTRQISNIETPLVRERSIQPTAIMKGKASAKIPVNSAAKIPVKSAAKIPVNSAAKIPLKSATRNPVKSPSNHPTKVLDSFLSSKVENSAISLSSSSGGSGNTIVGMVKKARKRQLFGLFVIGLILLTGALYVAFSGFSSTGEVAVEIDKASVENNDSVTSVVNNDPVPSVVNNNSPVLNIRELSRKEQFLMLKKLAEDVLKEDFITPLLDTIKIECFKGYQKIDVSVAHKKLKDILAGYPKIVQLEKSMPLVPLLFQSGDLTENEKISLCNALYPLITFDQLFLLLGKDLMFNIKCILSPIVNVVEKGQEVEFPSDRYLPPEDIHLLGVKTSFKPRAPFTDKEALILTPKSDSDGVFMSQNISYLRGGRLQKLNIKEAVIVFTPSNFSLSESLLKRGTVTLGIVRRQFPAAYRFKITVNGSFSFYITDTLLETEKINVSFGITQTTLKTETWYELPSSVFKRTDNNVTIIAESLWSRFTDSVLYAEKIDGEEVHARYVFVPILFGVSVKDGKKL